jgi:hypothetical protein
MKKKSPSPVVLAGPGENEIREYAFHLYELSNCAPGRDLANWHEATACLKANIPTHQAGRRLHQHRNGAYQLERTPPSVPVGTSAA